MRSAAEYKELWDKAIFLPNWEEIIDTTCKRLLELKKAYDSFAGIDWKLLAVLHMRECNNNFDRQILNGERWEKVTTLVPRGVGPFESWRDSTWYAIVHHGMNGIDFADITQVLAFMEGWNGWGYHAKGKQSPYLWSGTQLGVGTGKYVADGKYDPAAIDKQLGAATAYMQLIKLENAGNLPKPIVFGDHDQDASGPVHKLQTFLMNHGATVRGGIDGDFGPGTALAFQQVFNVTPYGMPK